MPKYLCLQFLADNRNPVITYLHQREHPVDISAYSDDDVLKLVAGIYNNPIKAIKASIDTDVIPETIKPSVHELVQGYVRAYNGSIVKIPENASIINLNFIFSYHSIMSRLQPNICSLRLTEELLHYENRYRNLVSGDRSQWKLVSYNFACRIYNDDITFLLNLRIPSNLWLVKTGWHSRCFIHHVNDVILTGVLITEDEYFEFPYTTKIDD